MIKASNNPLAEEPNNQFLGKLDRGGYVGTAQNLKDDIDSVLLPDGVLVSATITKVGNVVSIPALNPVWRYNKIQHTNVDEYSTTINSATENYHRTDIIVGTIYDGLTKIEGNESLEFSLPEEVPEGTILIATIPVFGTNIMDPLIPISGDNYISKSSQSPRRSYDDVIVDLENETRIILYTCTEINYINHLIPGQAYDGRQLFLTNENEDESDIVINNLFNHKGNFSFPNALPFVLKFRETIQFKLFYDFGGKVTYLYVGIISTKIYPVGHLQIFKVPGNTNNEILEPGDYCIGFVEGQFINADYLGGDKNLLASYNI